MDSNKPTSMLEDLSGNIDDLEAALTPLLSSSITETSSRLPLLDKAKLHVLATYAIDSLLFSALKLNGVDAKEHPVFTEINRVKQYFEKIKEAETGPAKPTSTLDKAAANRFIKHGLAGNAQYDREHAEKQARERDAARKQYEAQSDKLGTAGRFRHFAEKDADGAVEKIARQSDSPAGEETEQSAENQEGTSQKKEGKRKRKDKSEGGHKKHKSSNPPRAGSSVFQDLLARSKTAKK